MDKAELVTILREAESGSDRYPEFRQDGLAGESLALNRALQLLMSDDERAEPAFAALTALRADSPFYPRATRLRLLRAHRAGLSRALDGSAASELFLDALASGPGDTFSKRRFEATATRSEARRLREALARHAPAVARVDDAAGVGLSLAPVAPSAPAKPAGAEQSALFKSASGGGFSFPWIWIVLMTLSALGRASSSCSESGRPRTPPPTAERIALPRPPKPVAPAPASAPAPAAVRIPIPPVMNPEEAAYRSHMSRVLASPTSSGTGRILPAPPLQRPAGAPPGSVVVPDAADGVQVSPAAASVTGGAR